MVWFKPLMLAFICAVRGVPRGFGGSLGPSGAKWSDWWKRTIGTDEPMCVGILLNREVSRERSSANERRL